MGLPIDRLSSRLPRRFPVGAKYVVEGYGGEEGNLRVIARYVVGKKPPQVAQSSLSSARRIPANSFIRHPAINSSLSPACALRRRPLRTALFSIGQGGRLRRRRGIDANARVCFDAPPPAQPREHLAEATQQYLRPRFARTSAAPRQPRHASFTRFVHNAMNVVCVKRCYRLGRPAINQPVGNDCQPFRSRLQAKQASLLAPAVGAPHGVALNEVPRGGGEGCLDAARRLRSLALLGDPAVGDNILAHGSGAVHLLRHPPGADQGERHAKDRFSRGFLVRKIAGAKGQVAAGAARAPEA